MGDDDIRNEVHITKKTTGQTTVNEIAIAVKSKDKPVDELITLVKKEFKLD